ncbi:MAG: DNA polymerase III subunit beta [Mangrovibacterium sp.]
MKFVVSSSELLSHLSAISKVINSKNAMPILDNFLFHLEGTELTITASDLETTLVTSLQLDNVSGSGVIAIPAKLINDMLREFPEQPLTFVIDMERFAIELFSENGKFNIVGKDGEEYPQLPVISSDAQRQLVAPDILLNGITRTIFATADDELRPVMNGIFVELGEAGLTFVASDAHKLIRYKRGDVQVEQTASFILPKKPANLLKGLLPKETADVEMSFDSKNAIFKLSKYTLVCRLLEGKYPAYNSVIPKVNPNIVLVDRQAMFSTIKRISVFSSESLGLVKLSLENNQMVVSAQDVDYSRSAVERIACQYEGMDMEIGFKSTFLLEILSNIESNDVRVELSDSARAGLFLPAEKRHDEEDILMLLMPMMIGL